MQQSATVPLAKDLSQNSGGLSFDWLPGRPKASADESAGRSLKIARTAPSDAGSCTTEWFGGYSDELAIALQRSDCAAVELHVDARRTLIDTAQLPVARPINVTIVGKTLPDGAMPQLLISPRAKIKTSGAKSFWHFQGVDVIALSLDWFRHESDAEQLQQPNPRSEPSLGVRVSMSDCVLRSMKCATPPENDMAQSWLTTISEGNDSAVQAGENVLGTVGDTSWVDVAPWAATSSTVMFRFQNTSMACTPEDDTAIREMVLTGQVKADHAPTDTCYYVSDYGQTYRGKQATTETGRDCLHWGLIDQPAGGNIFSDRELRESGLQSNACRNPLGMLDKPWCFIADAPYIEHCALDVCPQPTQLETATPSNQTSKMWVNVLVVICSIAGVLLIALLLVLLMRAIWGGSLCPTVMPGGRKQGRSKREGTLPESKQVSEYRPLDSVSTDDEPLSQPDEKKDAEDSPAESRIRSSGSGRKSPSGSGFASAPPGKPPTQIRGQSWSPVLAHTASPRPASNGALPPAESFRRISEPQGGPGAARPNSMGHTRSSNGDGRSNASSRGLRPTTPPLHKSSSSHGEIRSQGSPMHHTHRRTSSVDHGYLEWQLLERPSDRQPGSSRSRGDETGSVNEERLALIASPTLQQIMQRSKPLRKEASSVGAAGVLEPSYKRNSGSGKSPREGDLRQRTIEEDLSHIHGIHDAVQRGNTYSVDSRSYATSSLQDAVNSAGFASGAVNSGAVGPGRSNTGRYAVTDMQHTTEGSTIVLDTTSAAAADTHHTHHSGSTGAVDHTPRDRLHLHQQQHTNSVSPEAATASARAAAAAAMVAGVHTSWVPPYRRPETERTISGSWTNSNSSPTGTLASRVAMQFPAGASFNMSAADGAVGLETFQSDRESHTSHYQVNLWEHDIKLGKRLGRGSFAQVFQGLWNDTAVAIKVIEYKEGARDAVDPCMEASLTKELTHPNVVITYDYGWTSHEINSLLSVRPESIVMVILMEYCNLKSLATNIRHTNRFGHQGGSMKWTPIAHTLVDILRGLMYLHDMDIIHGDIKAANVMLKSVHKTVSPVKFTAKLADLGLAQLRGDAVSAGAVGSLTHAAPELLNSRCNTPQSDVYAFGVLMYEIISGKEPFKGLSVTDLIRVKTTTHTADTLVLEPGDDAVYSAFAEIFHQCVASEPAERPTCKQLFKQLRTISVNCGLSSHNSTVHYQSIRVCPDSCSSPSKDMLGLSGAKAASLASVSSRYSRSPRSTDAASAAQLWAAQSGLNSEHGPYSQRRNMHWGTSSPGFQQTPLHMRSQMSPRTMSARSGWRSPSATSPHSPHTSHHGSPARSPRPDSHPFSYDYARPPTDEGPAYYSSIPRSNTPASMSGAMSPTHSERAMFMDTRRFEPARSGSVASSMHDTIRSLGPSTQADYGGTFERGNSLSARQRAHSTGVLSGSLHAGVPSPRVAYRQTHVYPTGAPAIASSEAVSPGGRAASASNSSRTLLGVRESVLEQQSVTSAMQGLSLHSRPNSADQYSDLHSAAAHHRRLTSGGLTSGGLSPSSGAAQYSPPGSQQLDVSVPGTALYNNGLFTEQAGGLSANEAGDETAPEDGDSSSDDSPRGNSRGGQRLTNDNSEMAATQAALGGLDSTDSFAGRRDLNLGSVDSFNLEMGNSSNLQRLMRDHNPPGKGAALAEPASGPSGGPSGTSLTLDDRRVVGTTIPEASATECTLDAIPSVSAIRRNSGVPANTRRQGALRWPAGYRGNGRGLPDGEVSGGGGTVDTNSASVAHGTSTITAQSSATVSLNLWGNNNSFQNSLMHDESPQGQVLAGAGDASLLSTDADAYPMQSIMESMRHMQSVAGNSSFMRRIAADQTAAERSTHPASLSDVQPALLISTSPANSGNAAPSGGAATGPDRTQSAQSMSNHSTTQSSGQGENTGNLDAPGWGRPAADASKQSGNDAQAAEPKPSLSASNLQPAPVPQLAGEISLQKLDKPIKIPSGAGLTSETHTTNVLSSSSISCGPVPMAGDRVGLSPASRPQSGGTHTMQFTSRTGSLSQTLSHNSLSSPQYMHTNVLHKPALAAGQPLPAMHRDLSPASLAHAPPTAGDSMSATRLSPDAVSLAASGHSQRPLTANMLQPASRAASVKMGSKPFGANRMDVQAWLQDVPDPADARVQPSPPTSPAAHHSRPRRHSLPVDQASREGSRSAGLGSGNPSLELKDAVAARQFERARQRLTAASAQRGSSR